jgi:hypothetical protein
LKHISEPMSLEVFMHHEKCAVDIVDVCRCCSDLEVLFYS